MIHHVIKTRLKRHTIHMADRARSERDTDLATHKYGCLTSSHATSALLSSNRLLEIINSINIEIKQPHYHPSSVHKAIITHTCNNE